MMAACPCPSPVPNAGSVPEFEQAVIEEMNGRLLLACRRGRTLFLSSPAPDRSGACGYVAIASEDPGEPPPGGKRAWRLLPEEALVAVDERLRLRVTSLLPE